MQMGDRQNHNQVPNWFAIDGEALPRLSTQDLKAIEALFENVDPEIVEHDLLQAKPQTFSEFSDWDLVDLIA